jgi:RNA polymerase sigma factor (TIGR02999 family)
VAGEITELLRAFSAGDKQAFDQLVPLVYDELRRVARRQMRRTSPGQTLNTTGLVHEAYLKLAGAKRVHLNDRSHLMAVAAVAMRQVLVGRARARQRAKRGAGAVPVELDEKHVAHLSSPEWLLDLDRALDSLRRRDADLARIFELRFFAGCSEAETAEMAGVSLRSVQRGFLRARAWLRAELHGAATSEDGA